MNKIIKQLIGFNFSGKNKKPDINVSRMTMKTKTPQ